ncbi:MAG: 3-phosphoshikimate 1-carboxyvinyltransferase [Thermoplasmata archaeon]|nr:3-phosphoshikimate 1-carboxyvinyltransferase [Thermoplasmata archaeon]
MIFRELRPGVVDGTVRAPPSKSYTHRALVIGAHTGRAFRVRRPLVAEDTIATANGLRSLGYAVTARPEIWTVEGPPRPSPASRSFVECRESGSTMRFLTAVAALQPRTTGFRGTGQLRHRPMEGLLSALQGVGARVHRWPPGSDQIFEVEGPIHAGRVTVDSADTSQFLSALLLSLPTLEGESRLRFPVRLVSAPYVDATLHLLARHGVGWQRERNQFTIRGIVPYERSSFDVPGDASSAAFLWVAAAVTGGSVRTTGTDPTWPQADWQCLDVLETAGARVRRGGSFIEVRGRATIPFEADLGAAPDLLPLLGVLAATIPGRSRLRGAEHAARKESNRRLRTSRLLRAFGARVRLTPHLLDIRGRERLRGRRLPTLPDHRLVMAAAVGALAADGATRIGPAAAVRKSFPGFWSALHDLGARTRASP